MGGGDNQGTVTFDKRPCLAYLLVIIIGWEREVPGSGGPAVFLGHGGEVWGECGRSGYGLNEGLVVVVEETVGPECGLFVFMNILEEVTLWSVALPAMTSSVP
jgi:hypothetical protein